MGDADRDGPDSSGEDGDAPGSDRPFRLSGPWDLGEMRSFLEESTVPIRLACRTPRGPWMLSLWYRYRDGRFHCATASGADVVEFLRADPEVAFEVSVNEVPYYGVRGRGTATVEPDEGKELLADLVRRYLGDTDSRLASRLLSPDREEVAIRIEPERVATWDYRERMRDVDAQDDPDDPT